VIERLVKKYFWLPVTFAHKVLSLTQAGNSITRQRQAGDGAPHDAAWLSISPDQLPLLGV